MTSLPCLACGKPLRPSGPPDECDITAPSAGTVFHSYGNYGSTVWDPGNDREWLELVVCDECVLTAARAGQVIRRVVTRYEQKHVDVQPWPPGQLRWSPGDGRAVWEEEAGDAGHQR